MTRKYEEAKAATIAAADLKMTLNSHKGDIEQYSVEQAVDLAKKELDELLAAAQSGDYEKTIIEAGDATNFLIAIVYNCLSQYRRRKKEK